MPPTNLFGLGYGVGPAGYGYPSVGRWSPLSLGSSLAAWYKADAGCYTDAACLFASASSMYASNSSASIAVGSGDAYWAGWVYLTTNTGTPAFFGKYGGAGDRGFIIWYQSGTGFTITASDDGTAVVSAADPTTRATGAWFFVEAKYTRSTKKVGVAVNGGAFTESAALSTAGIFASTSVFAVGKNDAGLGYLDGAAARIGMWTRILTSAERTWLYNAGAGRFYADLGVAGTDGSDLKTSLVEYWNLCESSSTRVGSHAGLNLTPTNGPTVAAGPGEGACVNNSPVKRWESQYGTAHRSQSDITKQPLWIASGVNGRPIVRGNSTSYWANTTLATGGSVLATFHALKYVALGAYHNLYENATIEPQVWFDNADKVEVDGNGSHFATSPLAYAGAWCVVGAIHGRATPRICRVNGAERATNATAVTVPASASYNIWNRAGTSQLQADVHEEFFVGADMADAVVTQAESYLNGKVSAY